MIEIGKPFELLEPTHRGLHRFVPRHPDEIEIDIGDPVYVQREAEDLWCEGNSQLSWSKIQRIILGGVICPFLIKEGVLILRRVSYLVSLLI